MRADGAVLVTGASGYIASWVCLYLLEQGFAIRGTTRDEKKGKWMKDMYKSRGHDKFDYVIVSDLENVGPFFTKTRRLTRVGKCFRRSCDWRRVGVADGSWMSKKLNIAVRSFTLLRLFTGMWRSQTTSSSPPWLEPSPSYMLLRKSPKFNGSSSRVLTPRELDTRS